MMTVCERSNVVNDWAFNRKICLFPSTPPVTALGLVSINPRECLHLSWKTLVSCIHCSVTTGANDEKHTLMCCKDGD